MRLCIKRRKAFFAGIKVIFFQESRETADKFDFIACMGAFFGVIFASVEIGLLIAVSIGDVLVIHMHMIY